MTYTFLFKNYLLAVCLHFSRSVKYSNNAIYRKVAVYKFSLFHSGLTHGPSRRERYLAAWGPFVNYLANLVLN
jgi:hypothetical protein